MAFTDFKSADEVQKAYQVSFVEKDFITFVPKALPEYCNCSTGGLTKKVRPLE